MGGRATFTNHVHRRHSFSGAELCLESQAVVRRHRASTAPEQGRLEAWSTPGGPEHLLSGTPASLPLLCPHALANPLILLFCSLLCVSNGHRLFPFLVMADGGGRVHHSCPWRPDRWLAHAFGEQQELPLFHLPGGLQMCGQHLANKQ